MSLDVGIRPGAGACVCVDLGTALSKASIFLGGDLPASAAVAPLPIGAASGAEHPLLTPSAMFVDEGRIYFGPAALKQAHDVVETKRSPILSFKMVLSAQDVDATLALKLGRAVDPTGVLRHRDALVLYLAYLDQLVRAAVASEPSLPSGLADAPRRLTSPHWHEQSEAGRVVARLVEESAVVSARLGAMLLNEFGVSLAQATEALERGRAAVATGYFEGLVFESHSAASAYANFAVNTVPHILVVDMGAGTTDMAGFEVEGRAPRCVLTEIEGARQCCALAGDEIDGILMDLFVRAGRAQGVDAEDRLWRQVRLQVKELKRDLFSKGKAVFKHGRRQITVARETLVADASFKAFCRALVETVRSSLELVAAKAQREGAVTILLAGGGSNMPFLADLVKTAGSRCGLKVKVEAFGTNWALPHRHHPLAGMFPQMAISMGGALAPIAEEMGLTPQMA